MKSRNQFSQHSMSNTKKNRTEEISESAPTGENASKRSKSLFGRTRKVETSSDSFRKRWEATVAHDTSLKAKHSNEPKEIPPSALRSAPFKPTSANLTESEPTERRVTTMAALPEGAFGPVGTAEALMNERENLLAQQSVIDVSKRVAEINRKLRDLLGDEAVKKPLWHPDAA